MTGLKRIILEMGMGNDLHGEDYTKAARRAIRDALHHSSFSLFSSLGLDPDSMEVELTLAAQEPEKIDTEAVKDEFPYGRIMVRAVKGGLNVPDHVGGRSTVVVNAGVVVRLPVGAGIQA